MSPAKESFSHTISDFLHLIQEKIHKYLGWWGIAILAVLGLSWYALSNWADIKTYPIIGPTISYLSRRQLPESAPDRYALVIAELDNDAEGKVGDEIIHSLRLWLRQCLGLCRDRRENGSGGFASARGGVWPRHTANLQRR